MKLTFSAIALTLACAGVSTAANTGGMIPTYTKDVAPILNRRCVECHRQGEAGKMVLESYKRCPPLGRRDQAGDSPTHDAAVDGGSAVHGHFSNDRRLSDEELATLSKWADNGAPEGNAADLPPAPQFVTGWKIPKPDFVIDDGVDFKIPVSGVIPYQYYKVDPGFKEDKWVTAIEVRPQQRAQVHHILVFIREEGKRITRAGEQFSTC